MKLRWYYIIIVLLSQVYSFNQCKYRIEYLRQINRPLSHLIFPTIVYKTKYGYYATIFCFAVFERYVKKDCRKLGHGYDMCEEIINNHHIYIVGETTINTYKKILDARKYKYINIRDRLIVRI
jgi:hypothetical protein